ncbi:O-acetyl-ADP-ribose deacetylase [Enterobacterales bacterium CwR94]|nr:O-acetyl-ADP-ribose deacetylase [Enterobacterales bacterium CwR94]
MKNRIRVMHGDITRLQVDAIVNAANPSLLGGGGVDGAIHRAAGPSLLAACQQLHAQQGDCPTGHAVITQGYKLPAKWVIHTVGPVWQGGEHQEAQGLAAAYRSSLQLAQQYQAASLAIPAISTGAYGFPKAQAATIAVQSISAFLQHNALPQQVWLICFDEESFTINQQALGRWLAQQATAPE